MKKLLKLPLILNKNNGQIISYFKTRQLPREITESIKKQNSPIKKLLLEYKGYE